MLPTSLRVAILIALIVYFLIFTILLKRKKLELKYSLLWLFSGLLMLILILFPQLLNSITSLVGIQIQSNALFSVLFFCTLIILVSLTSINSKQNESIKKLVQQNAQLEKRIRLLEEKQNQLQRK